MNVLIGFGSPWVTLVWAIALVSTVVWLAREFAKGRAVTIPSYIVLLGFLAPILVQYPFTFSPVNVLATGVEGFARYPAHIDRVFLISLVGILSFVAGFAAPRRVPSTFAPLSFISTGIRVWAQSAFLYISTLFSIAVFVLMGFLGLLSTHGARHEAMLNPALRPIFNFIATILPLIVALTLVVGIQRRRPILFVLTAINLGLAVLTGTRAAALGGLLLVALAVFCRRSLSTGLSARQILRLGVAAVTLLALAVYLGDVRDGRYNPIVSIMGIGAKLFYGNAFSDLRDFAWVHAYWHGSYFWGKTELAGLLSFVPSAMLPFRNEWGWGRVADQLLGFDPRLHAGVRPGLFGEPYFNFGIPGVIVAGALYGYIARRLHVATQQAARMPDTHRATLDILAAFVTVGFAQTFLITAGIFGIYVTVLTLVVLQLVALVARRISHLGPTLPALPPSDVAAPKIL